MKKKYFLSPDSRCKCILNNGPNYLYIFFKKKKWLYAVCEREKKKAIIKCWI